MARQIGTNGAKAQRLFARLRDECGLDLPEDIRLSRTYAGHWQLKAGAWKWCLWPKHWIGSQYTVTELLKAKRLGTYTSPNHAGDIEIDPKD